MARTNLCPNPALAVNATGWFGSAGWARATGLTGFTRTTGWSGTSAGQQISPQGTTVANQAYTFSAFAKATTGGADVVVGINWYQAGSYRSSSTEVSFTLDAGEVTRVWVTATSPPNTDSALLTIDTPGGQGAVQITQVLYEQSAALNPWFDGSSPGGSWTGTAGNSTSTIPDDAQQAGSDSLTLTDAGDATAAVLGVDTSTLSDSAVAAATASGPDSAALSDSAALEMLILIQGDAGDVLVEGVTGTLAKEQAVTGGEIFVEGVGLTVHKEITVATGDVIVEGFDLFAGNTAPDPGDIIVEGVEGATGKAGEPGADYGVAPRPIVRPRARMIAQRILTGEFLSWELPVKDPEIVWNLSSAVEISAVFRPEIPSLRDVGLEPWGTWIHYEEDGVLRGSGILLPTSIGRDGTLRLSAAGPLHYANRVPWRGQYSGVQVDPAAIVKMMWSHIQSFPRGNLGVSVYGTTPRRIGTEARDVEFVTGEGEVVSFEAGPYRLNYWENTLVGAETDKLAGETPFDLVESSRWADQARTSVEHRIDIVYPQHGRRRTDLRFAQGENIVEWAPIEEPGGAYADTVYVMGKGEGPDAVTGSAMAWVGNRIRLPAIVDDKTIDNRSRANATAADELAARLSALVEVPEIVINTRHRNAPVGSFEAGDEILPQIRVPYLGMVKQWHRITGIRYLPRRHRAVLSLTRRGEFRG